MFCIFSSVRYSNPKLMHVGHQHMAQTFDPKQFKGLLELQTFHISPDKFIRHKKDLLSGGLSNWLFRQVTVGAGGLFLLGVARCRLGALGQSQQRVELVVGGVASCKFQKLRLL